jgi:thymidylate synthase (FAD)
MTVKWQKYYPLSDKNAYICLVEHMGSDNAIVQAARVSYDADITKQQCQLCNGDGYSKQASLGDEACEDCGGLGYIEYTSNQERTESSPKKDRQLIRYLLAHGHTTPFEMVEVKFMVQVPMDCWRQWIRHRTANVNEYSTRYTEAIDACQVTLPTEWRLQATDNKQGSSGFLETYPASMIKHDEGPNYYIDTGFTDSYIEPNECPTPGEYFSKREDKFHQDARELYEERIAAGIAKEQARKDLPLSTYTRAYWKCDLHNIFNFLRLRMDSHAQLEIRSYANAMFDIIKPLFPVACEAFEDYVLHAKKFSRMEMITIREMFKYMNDQLNNGEVAAIPKPASMTDREWKEFLAKLS